MPTRCNRWFLYCRCYGFLNMFRAPLCPSSGAQEYYTGGCCLWYLVLWFSSCQSGVELWVVCPVCGMLQHPSNWTHNLQHLKTWKPQHQIPHAATTRIILLSSWWWTYWCLKHVEQAIRSAIKKPSVASSWHFISTYSRFHCISHISTYFCPVTLLMYCQTQTTNVAPFGSQTSWCHSWQICHTSGI